MIYRDINQRNQHCSTIAIEKEDREKPGRRKTTVPNFSLDICRVQVFVPASSPLLKSKQAETAVHPEMSVILFDRAVSSVKMPD